MVRKANTLVEPRVLWSVASELYSDEDTVPGRIRLPDGDFYNGSKYPIEIRHVILSAVNYTFREYAAAAIAGSSSYDNDMGIVNKVEVYLEAPRRQQLVIGDLQPSLYSRAPTGTPGMRYGASGGADDTASDIWGVTRWDFDADMKLVLPRKADISFQLSAFTAPDGMGGTFLDNWTINPRCAYIFNEDAANHFGGSSRLNVNPQSGIPFSLRTPTLAGVFPGGPQPFPADGFGAETVGFSAQILTTTQMWPPQHDFTSRLWGAQESNRGQEKNTFSGFAVSINQVDYDAAFAFAADAALQAAEIAPLSCRVGTRCKVNAGGSGEWWWRPGAPLCLVQPTLTPAIVHRLATPFTLGPGEGIFVEMQVPASFTVGSQEPITVAPTYNLGVALAGYAILEG